MQQSEEQSLVRTERQLWLDQPPPAALDVVEGRDWALLIAERLGLYFSPERWQFLADRLWRRVYACGLDRLALYRTYLLSHPAEWEALADIIVVNESRFFREASLFEAVGEELVPKLVRQREGSDERREIAVWSAGCSTGEETYSLAMIVLDALPLPARWRLRVLGTDLSQRNIMHARDGIYDARRVAALPETLRERYLEATAGQVRVKPAVRAATTFRQHNLCGESWPINSQDIIVCQNVIIYFRRGDQLRVLNRLYDTLRPGGCVLVSATDFPTLPIRPGVTPVRIGDALGFQRPHYGGRW